MAASATLIWEVNFNGSDTVCAGGFDPAFNGGAADNFLSATSANTASPVVTSVNYNFVAGDVGAWVYIKTGTNWTPGWYQIASVAANKATLTAGIGTAFLMKNSNPISTNTVVGCATTATPSSATWSIDYSQNTASITGALTISTSGAGATTVTITSNSFTQAMVGNCIYIPASGNFAAGSYSITNFTDTNNIVVHDSPTPSGAGAAGTGYVGGAFATPGQASKFKVAGNDIFIKYSAGNYSMTSSSANVAGGRVSDQSCGVGAANYCHWCGYNTTRHINNIDANRPTMDAGAQTSLTVFGLGVNPAYTVIRNLIVDGKSPNAAIIGIDASQPQSQVERCRAQNCTSIGIQLNNSQAFGSRLEATGCSGTAGIVFTGIIEDCESWANTTHGFQVGGAAAHAIRCRAYYNSSAGALGTITSSNVDGINANSTQYTGTSCVAYGNGRSGFDLIGVNGARLQNCIGEANLGEGYHTTSIVDGVMLLNCAGYNNTSGNYSTTNVTRVEGFIANTTGTFFSAPTTGDYTLNNTANQGALARAGGFNGTPSGNSAAGFLDIGALQHQDSGSGSGSFAPTIME